MTKKKKISRPPRVYTTKSGRQYIVINGRRRYIIPANNPVSRREAFNLLIKNVNKITNPRPRIVKRSRRHSIMRRPYQNQLRSALSHGGVSGSTGSTLTTPVTTLLASTIANSRDRLHDLRLLENRDNKLQELQKETLKQLEDKNKEQQKRIEDIVKDTEMLKEAGRQLLLNQIKSRKKKQLPHHHFLAMYKT